MKKKLLYIGNKLAHKGSSPTSIDILGPLLEHEGYKLYYASSRQNKLLRLLDMVFTVFKNRNTIDYVLIDTYSTANFWYAVMVGYLCKIMRLHYLPLLRGGRLPERLAKSPKICKKLFKNAYINIAPSAYLMESFQQHGFENVQLIPNSIPLDRYSFKKRFPLRPRLLWVRAFAEIYNPLLAIKIFKKLLKNYPDAQLCMVGADKDESLQTCRDYAEKYQLPVEFTGKLTKEEWIERASDFDIFINTTHYDNTPVSVIEAMALGLPVVSTNVGGMPYLLHDGVDALLVHNDDCEGFIEAINSLLKEPEKAVKMAKNARKMVENFDWESVKILWENILR
ncbi:MAG TPA: glycosyltransferase [Leeuwenhoekiella sp.]|nr:glycosyltransferase [Leeuwenhoekiella sp.]